MGIIRDKEDVDYMERRLNKKVIKNMTPILLLKIVIYMLNKYEKNRICGILPSQDILNNLKNIKSMKYIKYCIEMNINKDGIKVILPYEFKKKIKQCYESNSNVIILMVNIVENKNRFNIVVYDKLRKHIIRIDPKSIDGKYDKIDEYLLKLLRKYILIDKYTKSIIPICPSLSIYDKKEKNNENNENICNMWLFWNFEIIMKSQYLDMSTLLLKCFNKIYNNKIYKRSFITFITSYGNFLLDSISDLSQYHINLYTYPLDILHKDYVSYTLFDGSAFYREKGIQYILSKHHSCSTSLGIQWRCEKDERKIGVSKNFANEIRICYLKPVRFIFIWLTLTELESCSSPQTINIAHANVLIYDKKSFSLERFDPHGFNDKFDTPHLDLILPDFFSYYLPINNFYTPLSYCPRISFQLREENIEKLSTDPGGFCSAWTLWYIDLRLSNPDISRKEIVQFAINNISNSGSFRIFIRNYSSFIHSS